MTRKHFQLVADSMNYVRPAIERELELRQWRSDCLAIANAFAYEFPRFDKNRFLNACGFVRQVV